MIFNFKCPSALFQSQIHPWQYKLQSDSADFQSLFPFALL